MILLYPHNHTHIHSLDFTTDSPIFNMHDICAALNIKDVTKMINLAKNNFIVDCFEAINYEDGYAVRTPALYCYDYVVCFMILRSLPSQDVINFAKWFITVAIPDDKYKQATHKHSDLRQRVKEFIRNDVEIIKEIDSFTLSDAEVSKLLMHKHLTLTKNNKTHNIKLTSETLMPLYQTGINQYCYCTLLSEGQMYTSNCGFFINLRNNEINADGPITFTCGELCEYEEFNQNTCM